MNNFVSCFPGFSSIFFGFYFSGGGASDPRRCHSRKLGENPSESADQATCVCLFVFQEASRFWQADKAEKNKKWLYLKALRKLN